MELVSAIRFGLKDGVRELLADENYPINQVVEAQGIRRSVYTTGALLEACRSGHTSITRALLERGDLDVNATFTSQQMTALGDACYRGALGIVRILLEDERVDPYAGGLSAGVDAVPPVLASARAFPPPALQRTPPQPAATDASAAASGPSDRSDAGSASDRSGASEAGPEHRMPLELACEQCHLPVVKVFEQRGLVLLEHEQALKAAALRGGDKVIIRFLRDLFIRMRPLDQLEPAMQVDKLWLEFKRVDADESGSVDRDELRLLAAALGCPLTEIELKEAERALDLDDNGDIDFEEFTAFWLGKSGRGRQATPASPVQGAGRPATASNEVSAAFVAKALGDFEQDEEDDEEGADQGASVDVAVMEAATHILQSGHRRDSVPVTPAFEAEEEGDRLREEEELKARIGSRTLGVGAFTPYA